MGNLTMCRMFAYVGRSSKDIEQLANALSKSAKSDTKTRTGISHKDGWGYSIFSDRGIDYYTSPNPIYNEKIKLPLVEGQIFAIFHARKATDQSSVKKKFSHPLLGLTEDSQVFFAHNGSVETNYLKKALDVGGEMIDSELALRYVLKNGLESTKNLEEHTTMNSALNLLILKVKRDGLAELFVKHFYRKDPEKSDKTEYYNLYYQDMEEGKAVFSSTLNDNGLVGSLMTNSELVRLSEVK